MINNRIKFEHLDKKLHQLIRKWKNTLVQIKLILCQLHLILATKIQIPKL
jgi:hypothetical protein